MREKSRLKSTQCIMPPNTSARRLFHLASILAFIERCESEAKAELNLQ
jgi:hypothetical protein